MQILISDANILIDIEIGDLTPAIFRLPYTITVPDILFELELKDQHKHLLKAGLQVKSLTPESIQKTEQLTLKYPKPSILDHTALALALQENCPLLTGDKALRQAAVAEGVEVHGTLWLVQTLLQQKLIKVAEAKKGFDSMIIHGSRLPLNDIEMLLDNWWALEDIPV